MPNSLDIEDDMGWEKVIEWTKEYLWFQYNHKNKKRDWKDLKSQ